VSEQKASHVTLRSLQSALKNSSAFRFYLSRYRIDEALMFDHVVPKSALLKFAIFLAMRFRTILAIARYAFPTVAT
jgi:hypothetical protein